MAEKLDEVARLGGKAPATGVAPAAVAERVGVARQTVYTWKRVLDEGGIEALRQVRRTGPQSKLDEAVLSRLRDVLLESPTAHGFGTELWTLKRVRQIIRREFGVRHSEVHVWRLLGQLGFSSQTPEKRALERDEGAIRAWTRRTWPALKKSPTRRPPDRVCPRPAQSQRGGYH